MLAKHPTKVCAVLKCPCLACYGEGFDVVGKPCVACKASGSFTLPVEEGTVEEVDAWDDGPAWDAIAEKVIDAGAEIHDDAWRYEVAARAHNGGVYIVTLKIVPYPVSKETAAHFNALVRK
jgi:hypothetical protein